MSKKTLDMATEIEPSDECQKAASISRRDLLKKSVYKVPALIVLGSLASVGKATAANFPSEPGSSSGSPKPDNRPPKPHKTHPRDGN